MGYRIACGQDSLRTERLLWQTSLSFKIQLTCLTVQTSRQWLESSYLGLLLTLGPTVVSKKPQR